MSDEVLQPVPEPLTGAGAVPRVLLVGVDGQDGGVRALVAAGDLARRNSLEVVVGHVHPLSDALTPGECVQGLRDDAELDLLLTAAAVLDPLGVPWRLALTTGDPVTGLQELAEQVQAELVVIGTHGRGGWCLLRRLLHGSVSSRLVHGEHRPVLVVPPPGR
ncbi:MAG: hypothetical protein JWN17_3004 [Frankiales bacterium]|nr:hypothetical protein [Frankiales bacterium]